jgi:ribosomal protein S18 acetylase RimI-like enzyme
LKFFATIEPTLDWEPVRTIGSYLWYRSYVFLTPTTCFVLDDGEGRAVGYCIGTSNTSRFAESWRTKFTSSVPLKEIPRSGVRTDDPGMEEEESRSFRHAFHSAECSSLQAWPQELDRYPAHMHIDILEQHQRKGWGSKLINAFFDAVKRDGASGVHLDMVRWNTIGMKFYKKVGFERCSIVLDDGKSGETGVNDVVLTLVRAF